MTLIRPLNKGQGHSFWYQSTSHMRLPIGFQLYLLLYDAPFSHNRTYVTSQTDDRQTQHCRVSATVITVDSYRLRDNIEERRRRVSQNGSGDCGLVRLIATYFKEVFTVKDVANIPVVKQILVIWLARFRTEIRRVEAAVLAKLQKLNPDKSPDDIRPLYTAQRMCKCNCPGRAVIIAVSVVI